MKISNKSIALRNLPKEGIRGVLCACLLIAGPNMYGAIHTIFDNGRLGFSSASGDAGSYGVAVLEGQDNPLGSGKALRIWDQNGSNKPDAYYEPDVALLEPFRVALSFYNQGFDLEDGPRIALRIANQGKAVTNAARYQILGEFFSDGTLLIAGMAADKASRAVVDANAVSVTEHTLDAVVNANPVTELTYTLYGELSRTLAPLSIDVYLDGELLTTAANGAVYGSKSEFNPQLGIGRIGFTSQSDASTKGDIVIDKMFLYTEEDLNVIGGPPPVLLSDPVGDWIISSYPVGAGVYWHPEYKFFYPAGSSGWMYLPPVRDWVYLSEYDTGDQYFTTGADGKWYWSHADIAGYYWSYDNESWEIRRGQDWEPVLPERVVSEPMGFATVADMGVTTVTGGKGGETINVTTIAELKAAAWSEQPLIIVIQNDLTGSEEIPVRSNKTILGRSGGVTLIGVGIKITKAVSNIIVRNLRVNRVRGVNGGDCIIVSDDSHHVWIDHCEVFNESPYVQTNKDYYDGLIDITNGADYVTVSWSHLHSHHKFMLIGSTDSNSRGDIGHLQVTVHHTLFENLYEGSEKLGTRGPSLRFGRAHLFNNHYRNINEGPNSRNGAKIRLEQNVFTDVATPWRVREANGHGFGCYELIGNIVEGSSAISVPECEYTVPYEYDTYIHPVVVVEELLELYAGATLDDPFEGLP